MGHKFTLFWGDWKSSAAKSQLSKLAILERLRANKQLRVPKFNQPLLKAKPCSLLPRLHPPTAKPLRISLLPFHQTVAALVDSVSCLSLANTSPYRFTLWVLLQLCCSALSSLIAWLR